MKIQKTAWETWQDAGKEFALKMKQSRQSIVPLGEEAYIYAASRGLPHQDIIRRAFYEGYHSIISKINQEKTT